MVTWSNSNHTRNACFCGLWLFFELHYHVGPMAAMGILLKRHPVEGCNERQSFEDLIVLIPCAGHFRGRMA